MKKLLWLFALITVSFVFEQCTKDCSEPPPYFLIKYISISHGAEDIRTRQFKNPQTPEITIGAGERYHIFLDFEVDYTTSIKPGPTSVFFNAAYARAPCPTAGEMGSKYPVTDLRVTSNADFDSVHLKGSLLNRFFRESYSTSAPDSLQASDMEYFGRRFSIACIEKPKLDSIHNFKVEFTLSNGDTFWAETKAVTFKKK